MLTITASEAARASGVDLADARVQPVAAQRRQRQDLRRHPQRGGAAQVGDAAGPLGVAALGLAGPPLVAK